MYVAMHFAAAAQVLLRLEFRDQYSAIRDQSLFALLLIPDRYP